MSNVIIKKLDPEQYYLLEEFCKEEGIEAPSPEFSWVEAAIDLDLGKIVGICVTQMLIHSEPLHIKKEYQGVGIKEKLMDNMENRLDSSAAFIGKPVHVYAEPTNVAAERILRMRGFTKSERHFWTKFYVGSSLVDMLPNYSVDNSTGSASANSILMS